MKYRKVKEKVIINGKRIKQNNSDKCTTERAIKTI